MDFKIFGKVGEPTIILIPGLGVSYEIFLPLIGILEDKCHIIAAQVDGFTMGKHTAFTSVDDQAGQIIGYIKGQFDGKIECAYGLSLGGKILSRVLERGEVAIGHSVMDAAPLLPPSWVDGKTAELYPGGQRVELLPLDQILEVGIPFPLLRCAPG